MAKGEMPEPSTRSPEMIVISITVVDPPPPDRRRFHARFGGISLLGRPRAALAVAVGVIALGALIITAMLSGPSTKSSGTPRSYLIQHGGTAAIAGAAGYPYPLFCLSLTTLASGPRYALPDVARGTGCERYHRHIDAEWRRVNGTGHGHGP